MGIALFNIDVRGFETKTVHYLGHLQSLGMG